MEDGLLHYANNAGRHPSFIFLIIPDIFPSITTQIYLNFYFPHFRLLCFFMIGKVHFTQCPVCGSTVMAKFLTAKDYTVSGEEFEIFQCNSCSLRFTQDPPDAASIGSYYKSEEYISHTDTSKGLINKLYRLVRKKALKQKRRVVEKETRIKHGSLLDAGSGTGSFAAEMKNAGWQVTGLEPDADARRVAEEVNGIKLLHADELFNLSPGSYDAITLWHVLEHVHELSAYLKQFKILLKENGKLFIAVPNYTSMDATVYKQYWAGYDTPRHLYHFSPQSMQKLMDKEGLQVIGTKPMWYDSFYVSLLSSKYKYGKTNWPAALWTGLRSNIKAIGKNEKCSSLIYIVSK